MKRIILLSALVALSGEAGANSCRGLITTIPVSGPKVTSTATIAMSLLIRMNGATSRGGKRPQPHLFLALRRHCASTINATITNMTATAPQSNAMMVLCLMQVSFSLLEKCRAAIWVGVGPTRRDCRRRLAGEKGDHERRPI
jgi:hypothetical protein